MIVVTTKKDVKTQKHVVVQYYVTTVEPTSLLPGQYQFCTGEVPKDFYKTPHCFFVENGVLRNGYGTKFNV